MRKWWMLVVIVMTLVGLGGTARAQSEMPVFCGDLATADCDLLKQSAQAMLDLRAAALDFETDFKISDIPDFPGTFSLRITGTGAYALTGEMPLASLMAPEMMSDPKQVFSLMENLLKSFSGDLNLLIFLPQNLPNMGRNRLPEKVGLSARLVDGVGYLNLEKLAGLGRPGELPKGWIGMDLAALFQMASQMMEMPDMPQMPTLSYSTEDMMKLMTAYVSLERLADTTVGDQPAGVFRTSINMGALFASQEYQDLLRKQMEEIMKQSGQTTIKPAEMDMIMGMYGKLFADMVFYTTQTIGLNDGFVHRMEMVLDWPIDLSAFSEMAGDTAMRGKPVFGMTLTANLSSFNDVPAIEAPPNATIAPLSSLFGSTQM